MTAAAVRFHPAAAQEAETAHEWYEKPRRRARLSWRATTGHRRCCCEPSSLAALRGRARQYVFPRYPFSLVYILRRDNFEVVAVAHGRRRRFGGRSPRRWAAKASRPSAA